MRAAESEWVHVLLLIFFKLLLRLMPHALVLADCCLSVICLSSGIGGLWLYDVSQSFGCYGTLIGT